MVESFILFAGLLTGYYFIKLSGTTKHLKLINIFLDIIVILIIFMMGYNFSIFTQTNAVVVDVIKLSLVYTVVIFFANILGLRLLLKLRKVEQYTITTNKQQSQRNKFLQFIVLLSKSSKYVIYLVLGYIIGEIFNLDITYIIDKLVFILLFGLMLLIGVLLNLENITISQIFKNRLALLIVCVVVFTSVISAIIISLIVNIPLKQSIMISSGLGWYSLSAILNTEFIGEYYGIATLLIDFSREIIVITAIPLLKNILKIELVGYAANTAMDFSLLVIKDNYGTKMAPLAISIGLIFTIVTPIILVLENIIL